MVRLLTLLVAACLLFEGLPMARPSASSGACCESDACCCAPAQADEGCCVPERETAPRGPRLSAACGCGNHGPAHLGAAPQPRSADHARTPRIVAEAARELCPTAPCAPDAPPVEPLRRPPRRA